MMGRKFSRIVAVTVLLLNIFSASSQDGYKRRNEPANEIAVPEMSVSDNKLTLKNAPVGKHIVIYTIIGNKVRQIEIKSPDEEHELKLPRAIYIIKLEGIVRKFVIR
jgi:hypothetical protein